MGEVKLVAITKPLIEGINTAEEFIAYCARVSNPANQLNNDSASKLMKYCVKNKHWSIFETVNLVIEINTTRDIGRQILRHKSFSFQEFSQRYAVPPIKEFDMKREARLQDTNNRQNSIELEDGSKYDIKEQFEIRQEQVLRHALDAYGWALEVGIAKEQARIFLPEGMSPTHMYMSGSLRSWIHYCELRMGNGTQKEHREIAKGCWKIITTEFPSLKEVLEQ
jgi:thymidylate synthase (FAD)